MQLPASVVATTALTILIGAVIIGAATAYMRLADRNTPFDIGLLHGRAGAAATVLLLVSVVYGNESSQNITPALGLLLLTILGGVTLYYLIRRKGILSKGVILAHASFAIGAVYTILFGLPL